MRLVGPIETAIGVYIFDAMTVTRQQAIQLVYALLYGSTDTAHLRLDKPIPARLIASVRRLLDEDVARARASQDLHPACTLAFYDELPAGTGHEVQYTPFRVFNLAIAHELTRSGFKQGEVVELVAAIQDKLKSEFEKANAELRERRAHQKIFLFLRRVEATESAVEYFGGSVREGERLNSVEILDGSEKLGMFLSKELADGTFGAFVMELSKLAVRVTELVQHAPVRKRGRQPTQPPSNWSDVIAQFRVRDRDYGR